MSLDFLSLGDPLAGAAETGGGADTTLAVDTEVGDSTIHVASATGIADGDFLRIGDAGEVEIREVATGGVTGTTITLVTTLTIRHDSGDQVREVDDAGTGPSLVNLWDADFSGFAYAARKSELRLIGNGVDAGNVVIQESAKPFRDAQLSFIAQSPVDRDTVRGYEEDGTVVTFTDYDGSTCSVVLFSYSASPIDVPDMWKVTVQLLQQSEPVPLVGP